MNYSKVTVLNIKENSYYAQNVKNGTLWAPRSTYMNFFFIFFLDFLRFYLMTDIINKCLRLTVLDF